MKISWIVTASVLVAAAAVGWRDHGRLSAARERGEVLAASQARHQLEAAASENKTTDRTEEDRRNARELMEWLKQFNRLENVQGEEIAKAVSEILKRMESMTANQAVFILQETLEGRGINGFPGPMLFNRCMAKLSIERPLKAIELFSIYRDKSRNNQHVREIGGQIIGDSLMTMARDNPASAVHWLRTEGDKFREHVSEGTKRGVLFNIGAKDPVLAFQMIGELGLKPDDTSLGSIVRAARTDDERKTMLAALRGHLGNMSGEDSKKAAAVGFGAFAERLAPGDTSQAAAQWLAGAHLTPQETECFVTGVISKKMNEGVTGGWMEWFGKNIPPDKADADLRKLFTTWTETDYQAAGQWLAATPPGPLRDLSIRAYAETAAKYDPETAGKWALTLPPVASRDATLTTVVANWPRETSEDEKAVADFAAKHGIEQDLGKTP